jgi:predicted enzyme related to lactoylglutathione lyase
MHPRSRHALAWLVPALASLALVAGCATSQLPPITQSATGELRVGKFVWFDLLTEDVAAARRFYGELFGWQFDGSAGPTGYLVIRNAGVPIAGLAEHDDREAEARESLWLPSLSVADVDAAAHLAGETGGAVLVEPVDAAGRGRLAAVRGPGGAAVVLLRASDGDPPDGAAPPGGWLWVDLLTHDATRQGRFYADLVGYDVKQLKEPGGDVHHVLLRDGRARAGVVEIPWKEVESNWLPYVRTQDVSATVKRARALGGRLLWWVDRTAVLLDPTGAAFGVQQRGDGARGAAR